MAVTQLMTIEEFATLSDAAGHFELIWGEPREVAAAGRRHGVVGQRFNLRIGGFADERNLGETYISDTGFVLFSEPRPVIVMPDVAFVRRERLIGLDDPDGYLPFPPDLAVEVRSPSDERAEIEEKIDLYRAARLPLLWYCAPRPRAVTVYRPDREPEEIGEDGELDGEDVLPGFRLRLVDIFN